MRGCRFGPSLQRLGRPSDATASVSSSSLRTFLGECRRHYGSASTSATGSHATLPTAGGSKFVQSSSSLPEATSMKEFGFQNSTPNFNVNFNDLPSDADIGDVETEPAKGATIAQLRGPWLMMLDGLHGELFVERDGYAFYRPADGLGYGVGRMTLKDSSIGVSTFHLRMEIYTYENITANPPLASRSVDVAGLVSVAKAKKSLYETYTLNGRNVATRGGNQQQQQSLNNEGAFNAAKLTPWDPDTAPPPTWKGPSKDVRDGFAQLFPAPLRLTSHLERAKSSSKALQHVDLTPFKVGPISNVYYVPNYLTQDEQAQMMHQLKHTPEALKTKLTKRLVQEWGCTMCPTCNKSFVSDANLPPWTAGVCDMMLYDGIFTPTTFPNNVRIHEYETNEGIAPHCDGPIYVPKVAILSLASSTVMSFYPRRDPYEQPMEHYNDTFRFDGDIAKEVPVMSLVLEPGSMLIFEDEAYTHHPHGISDRAVDTLEPEVAGLVANRHLLCDPDIKEVPRNYRASVTIRNLLPRCNHEPERAEHNLKRAWQLYHHEADVGFALVRAEQPSHSGTSSVVASPAAEANRSPPVLGDANAAKRASMETSPQAAPPAVSASRLMAMETKIDQLLAQQKELTAAVRDLQSLVAGTTTTQLSFQKETSTILNHLSSTVLQMENAIEELSESQPQR